ncbi:hypothetical protein LTS07_002530 [Exophiala sideris]|uniref:Nitrogen regulatory protein areA GATA-like domain-containing protein n=1 Tax=Exophiala sideris TaxID=1016849 RepID=A0ABR0JJ68_9EURO|nr:hypothetical protein LTR13_008268 [Exophiala sideris]KAK5035095.1 hypothetical protein LTS07_002530 [Exophiala sideris]KAK5066018.1 hypothetical protein LTR69_002535 [Exophiala sideris]KAK5178314.1 hypothetical protein LTR44_009190 [Eurotiomycetes sp. CCFEE 6388]
MPWRAVPEVLKLDANKMHEIDPSNAVSLKAMWTMFSKCSDTIREGHRYENMSWRVWSRESLCVTPAASPPATSRVPSLSNSFSSDVSLNEKCLLPRSRSFGQDECASSLSKSKHLTSDTLEKIMVTIQEKSEICPLSPSIEASLPTLVQPESTPAAKADNEKESRPLHDSTDSCISNTTSATLSTTARKSEHRDSDTSVSSDGLIRSGSVVHGFSPATSSFRSRKADNMPPPVTSKLIPKPAIKPGMFTLGGSSEDESSFEQRVLSHKLAPMKSSLSQSLSKTNLTVNGQSKLQPKRTSFKDVVAERRIQEDAENDEGAIESSDEEDDTDDIMESAIDEDEEEDGDEWEDSNSDDGNGKVAQEPHLFRRVDSRPDLVSRRSMLTLALNKSQTGLNHAYSQPAIHRNRAPSSHAEPMAASLEEEDGMMMQSSGRRPIEIPPPNASGKTMAHSPRTTRRNMLSTELTESLRKNLLWERQQKSQAANAFLKRSRNAQSMANLQSHTLPNVAPPQAPPVVQETSKNNSWNHYFDNPWEYHAKGW